VAVVASELSIAVVGAGRMGRWHAAAARRAGARVAAVVDQDPDAARRLAAAVRAAPEASLERALGRGGLDAVHLCTPVETHFGLASTALEAGLPVLIEKPLACDAGEARRLVELARARGLYLCPTHQYAFQDGVEAALARRAELGPLRRIAFDICSAGAAGAFAGRPEAVVGEILPHPLAIVQRLLPDARLDAVAWSVARPAPGEFCATGEAEGVLLSLYVSLSVRPTRFSVRIDGDDASFELDGFHGFGLLHRGPATRAGKLAAPFQRGAAGLWAASANLAGRVARWEPAYPGLQALTARFYATVRDGAPAPISYDQMLQGAAARDALLAAAAPAERQRAAHG
jgi:predicted dehydrogenase